MLNSKNIYSTVLVVLVSIFLVEFLNSTKPKHPDANLNIEQLINKYGYPVEVHQVTTDDGYILTLHRIPHGRNQTKNNQIPILFMHGLMQSATEFINLGPEKALSFLLADRGYDIWLGNARGTTWSRKHKNLDPDKDLEFWDFTLHEIGIYDVPAFIDYILETTSQEQLHYIGYSQGTITFFISVCEKPQYADKVKLMTAFAPAVFIKNPKSPALRTFIYFRKSIEKIFEIFKTGEFLSNDGLIAAYLHQICNQNSLFVDLCLHHIFIIQGYSPRGVNK